MPKDSHAKTGSALKLVGILAVAILMAAGLLWSFLSPSSTERTCDTNDALETTVVRGDHESVDVEVADTNRKRTKGLSDRNCLDQDHGLLFVFEQASDHCFWMKDMNFAIDIIWINENKQIIEIEKGAQPDSYPHTFCPSADAKYVLEINKGGASSRGWTTGTQLDFQI